MLPEQTEQLPVTLPPIHYQYPRAVPNPMVRDYVVWSLFNFTTLNCCCLGFLALMFSIKSRDRKIIGDLEGAITHGKTAKYMNIAATTGCIIFFIIISIIMLTSAAVVLHTVYNTMDVSNVNNFRGK